MRLDSVYNVVKKTGVVLNWPRCQTKNKIMKEKIQPKKWKKKKMMKPKINLKKNTKHIHTNTEMIYVVMFRNLDGN